MDSNRRRFAPIGAERTKRWWSVVALCIVPAVLLASSCAGEDDDTGDDDDSAGQDDLDRRVSTTDGWTQVEVSKSVYRTCALSDEGAIWCWDLGPEATRVFEDDGRVYSQVSVESPAVCGLYEGGVDCTCLGGSDTSSTCANRTGQYVWIAAGEEFTAAVTEDGEIEAWGCPHSGPGSNVCGEFTHDPGFAKIVAADDIVSILVDGTINFVGDNEIYNIEEPGFVQVEQDYGLYAVDVDSRAHCLGWNFDEQVWEDGECASGIPDEDVIQISTNGTTVCVILADTGELECWGSTAPVNYPPSGAFRQIGVSHGFACGVREDGFIECWGCDYDEELKPACVPP